MISLISKSQIITPQVISSGGNYSLLSNFSNSFTLGEMTAIETFSGNNFWLTQGFQQTFSDATTGIGKAVNLKLNIFPNPSNGFFYINCNATNIKIEIFDITGNMIYVSQKFNSNPDSTWPIDLKNLSDGIYLLKAEVNSNGIIKQFRIPVTIFQ